MKENNILLAEFLGWESIDNNKSTFKATQPYYITTEDIDFDFRNIVEVDVFETAFDDMKFSEDWNWLMLVVDKIESLSFNGRKVWTSIKTFNTSRDENYHEMKIRVYDSESSNSSFLLEYDSEWYDTKIEATYTTCVEFVKWYNENK